MKNFQTIHNTVLTLATFDECNVIDKKTKLNEFYEKLMNQIDGEYKSNWDVTSVVDIEEKFERIERYNTDGDYDYDDNFFVNIMTELNIKKQSDITLGDLVKYQHNKFKKGQDDIITILKEKLGSEYDDYAIVINNSLNGLIAWSWSRLKADLNRVKAGYTNATELREVNKLTWTSTLTTFGSTLNVIATIIAPVPTREKLDKILEDRTLDIRYYMNK